MNENNLPVKVEKRNIIKNIKNTGIKCFKILSSSLGVAVFSTAIVTSAAMFPLLIVPSLIGGVFCTQALLNNTKNRSFKDLAFITSKHKGNTKIYQDVTRMDLTGKMKGFSNIEKAAFMQMQAIIGLSKFPVCDRKGKEIIYETDTHGINQKTFKKLQELGYIKDYEEKFLKDTRLILPKIAFGNLQELNKKVKMYNIKFKLTGKPIDLEDPDLRRYFPMVFGEKNGIVAKKGYNFVRKDDGSITIEYNSKTPYMQRKDFPTTRKKKLTEELRKGSPSLQEQSELSKRVIDNSKVEKTGNELEH